MIGNLRPTHTIEHRDKRNEFQVHYCSLCASLRRQSGLKAGLMVNFDSTFMLLAVSHFLNNHEESTTLCPSKFFTKKRKIIKHPIVDITAQLTHVLGWIKCVDIIVDKDENSKYILAKLNKNWLQKKSESYMGNFLPETIKNIKSYYFLTQSNEKDFAIIRKETYLLTKQFAIELLSHINADDEFSKIYPEVSGRLGELVCLLDAIVDLKKDLSTNSYNPIIFEANMTGKAIVTVFNNFCDDYLKLESSIIQMMKINKEYANDSSYYLTHQALKRAKKDIRNVRNYVFKSLVFGVPA